MRLCLLDKTTVRVDVGGRCIRCTHVDFGMAHGHTRRPTRSLGGRPGEFCEHGGYFRTMRLGDAQATTKLISRVRKDLQEELFGIDGSPLPSLPERLRLEIRAPKPAAICPKTPSVTFSRPWRVQEIDQHEAFGQPCHHVADLTRFSERAVVSAGAALSLTPRAGQSGHVNI